MNEDDRSKVGRIPDRLGGDTVAGTVDDPVAAVTVVGSTVGS